MGKDLSKSEQEKLLKSARTRFERAREANTKNRERALRAIRFRALDQWPEDVKRLREQDPEGARPCLVVDKTNQHVNQVKNDQRQNRPSIKVRPVDDKSDKEVAKIFNGIIRHIEDSSGADVAYDTGFEHAVDGGYGYWRITTEFCDEKSFDQDIRIKRIRNRFAVELDPDHQEPDGSDAKYGFVWEELSKDEYEKAYPNHEIVDWEKSDAGDWIKKDVVRIAEYFVIDEKTTTIHLMSNGDVIDDSEKEQYAIDTALEENPPTVVKSRETKIPKVCWYKINGKEVLETKEWAGKYIPIVKVIGDELDIEGEVRLTGLIEPAMDAQRIHNYASSAFVENVALAPKAPYIIAEGQAEGHEDEWKSANRRNLSALTYKPTMYDNQTPVPPPMRQQPPGISQGWLHVLQNSEHDIQASMGRYNASLGAESNEKSGKALLAKQREGDVGSFHFVDNHARSIRYTGRQLIDLIPKIYDTQRIARILGEDGEAQTVELNPDQDVPVQDKLDEFGKVVGKIYNLNVGKYDVTVAVGPSYTTKRQEAAESMVELVRADPTLMAKIGDIMVDAMDWPEADRVAERLKKMLPPELQAEEGEDQDPRANAMVKILMQQLEEAKGMVQQAVQSVEAMEAKNKSRELDIKMYEAETKRLEIISDKDETQKQIGEISQQVQGLMQIIQPQQQVG